MHFGSNFCNPVTSRYFSWILMNWSESSPRKGSRQFYYLDKMQQSLALGTSSLKAFPELSFQAQGRSSKWEEKRVAKQNDSQISQEHKGQKPVSIFPYQVQQACPTRLMKRTSRGLSSMTSTKEHLPAKHLSNLSCRAASLPAPHRCWLHSSSHQQLSCRSCRELFQLPNILSKSMHRSTNLLPASKNTVYFSECR